VAAATTAGAVNLWPCFVHIESPATQISAVQRIDGCLGFSIRHLDKSETARPASVPIRHELHALHGPVRFK
jgi:hypothetical protein